MKFSIVTISYNQAAFLERAIASVLGQQGVDLEYIVVDPGSTDGSRDIIARHAERISHLILDRDAGPADGLNKGFAVASGDIYGFINADDELLPGALARVAEAFGRNPSAGIIAGCGYMVDANGRTLRPVVPTHFSPWLYAHRAVTIFQQGSFFRSQYFHQVNGFNTSNTTCWDGELFLDICLGGARFHTIGEDLALFRIHDGSITGTGRLNERYARDTERLFAKAMGRPRRRSDGALDALARVLKFPLNPAYLARRLSRRLPGY